MNNNTVYLKIYLPQSTIQFRMNQKKANELAAILRSKANWIDLPVSEEQVLHLKSETVMGYEVTSLKTNDDVQKGLMKINALASKFGIHPVSLSRLIAAGKIPAVSTEGKKRKHSQANINTALALRSWMMKQNKETLSEGDIKKLFNK